MLHLNMVINLYLSTKDKRYTPFKCIYNDRLKMTCEKKRVYGSYIDLEIKGTGAHNLWLENTYLKASFRHDSQWRNVCLMSDS